MRSEGQSDSPAVPDPLPTGASHWRREPFRLFFPLAVLLAWVGIGHWLLYATGAAATYSCMFHGLVQMQSVMMAFAVGFLLTALPRRTQAPPATRAELTLLAAMLIVVTAASLFERWAMAQVAYLGLLVLLLQFAIRRFLGRAAGRRPPAAFVLVPLAALHGILGAGLITAPEIAGAPVWMSHLGRLLVQQGVFLCLVVGVGSLVLPLMAGAPPPPDLGSSPRESWKALAYLSAGIAIFASLLLEEMGFARGGPLLRALTIALGLGIGGGAWRLPAKTGTHRKLVWLSAWLMPIGLVISVLWPDYRVPALHILFIGGFAMMAFGVATHVAVSHLDMGELAVSRQPVVIALGAAFLIALGARLAADASEAYFAHLGWAAAIWILGSAAWLAFFGPRLLRP
jgi:uncharacterized protein involved in response to NO